MKKILSAILLITLLISALCILATAENFVGEGEFTIASYNGVNTFVKTAEKTTALEDSIYWLLDNKASYNLKYVSFIGRVGNACQYTYAKIVTNGGGTIDDLTNMSLSDPIWNEQYKRFANTLKPLTDEGIPYGISVATQDYVSDGINRSNLQADYLGVETIMHEDAEYEYYDDQNYVTIIDHNGKKYMVFQLELWPREAALDWFNITMEANPDKYAIIYTTSFVDESGAMYTMWDWANGFKSMGTTSIKARNLTHSGKPRDGEGLWNYSFGKFDNILAIVSCYNSPASIVTSTIKNDRGVEVASIAANADAGRHGANPALLLLKLSADNTEITCAWADAFEGVDKSSVTTIKLGKIGTLAEPEVKYSLPQIPTQYNGANTAYIFGYEGNTFRPNANMTRAEACTIFARLILGTQTIPEGYTTRFEDVKTGDWFYNAIAYLDETGYFHRNTNTKYKPNEPITRAEFVELANSASSLVGNSTVTFNDVPEDHFYYDSIVAAAASGLVNGYEDGTFRPDNTITRAEVVTVINRLLGLTVSARTVSMSNLENEFVDITTHWGRLNILMASNSNVHGDYYYEATLDGVKETSSAYTFANKHFSFELNKKNGKISKITNLLTGEDITRNAASPQLLYITNAKGDELLGHHNPGYGLASRPWRCPQHVHAQGIANDRWTV
ncbi:MAG: S-layer homology domain-containing protein, partial [Clostridia bacterium]|nr:S-layer homology domain-containing protein [Clostridia bacterium]